MGTTREFVQKTSRQGLEKLFAALNRADEVGGDVRDFIIERVLTDERYVRVRKRVAAARGKEYVSLADRAAAEKERIAASIRAAPAPVPAAPQRPEALGNPEIAAQIYGRSSCPWTGRAISLLEQLKADYDHIDMDDMDNADFEGRLVGETGQSTTPWVYVRGEFVGGFNSLSEVQRLGKLDRMLLSAEERAKDRSAMDDVVVASRPNSDQGPPEASDGAPEAAD